MKLVVLLILVGSISSILYAHEVANANRLRLSTNNPGDVYLVTQFIVLLSAAEGYNVPKKLEIQTPVTNLASKIGVQKNNGIVFFWNKNSARIILIIEEIFLNTYINEVSLLLVRERVDLNFVFNELLGVNYIQVSDHSIVVFNALGKLLAEIIGIGEIPTGLLNLHGLQIFKQDIDMRVFEPSTMISGIGFLANAENVRELAQQIGRVSVLINQIGRWNSNYVLQDKVYTITTSSGYLVGNLLGNKNLVATISSAIRSLMANLPIAKIDELLVDLITSIAFDFPTISVLSQILENVPKQSYNVIMMLDNIQLPDCGNDGTASVIIDAIQPSTLCQRL